MTCKHRFEPVTYIQNLPPNRYYFVCQRCGNLITALLKASRQ